MIKQLVLGLVLPVVMASVTSVSIYANNGQGHGQSQNSDNGLKVFVCKYVGKPGTDERLQTGNNPISVSVNAIPDYKGIGSEFADKQGRSVVIAVDTTNGGGQDGEPSVKDCPAPTPVKPVDTPKEDPKTPVKVEVPKTPVIENTPKAPVTPGSGSVTKAPVTPVVPVAAIEALPVTSGNPSLAITLIAAGLATALTGLGVGVKALYRR